MTLATGRPADAGRTPHPSIPLGIEAKSIHAGGPEADTIGDALGGIQPGDRQRKRRFDLLRGAAGILWEPGRDWKEQHRTVGCHRHVTDATFGVTIRRRLDGSSARYSGIHTCGSIWTCPVCAERISSTRREELRLAHAAHVKAGGACYLLTLTFPHERGRDLPELLDLFARAQQRFKNSRRYKAAMLAIGRVGNVKALEVTFGANGWHPHVHEVIFAAPGAQDRLEHIGHLRDAWIDACIKAGLAEVRHVGDMLLHAVDFKAGAFVTDYIAKFGREPAPSSREINALRDRWGVHSEATRFTTKIGNIGHGDYSGLTPFALLADAHENGNTESRALFRAYANAFQGKRQLTWTPGLKKSLGLAEIEDEEIARGENTKPEEEHCIRLDVEDWRLVLQHDRAGARFAVLHVAAKYGADGVRELLDVLRAQRPDSKGQFRELGRSRIH